MNVFLSVGQKFSEAMSSLWPCLCFRWREPQTERESVCGSVCAWEREVSLRPSDVTLPRAVSESPLWARPPVGTLTARDDF